MKELEKQKGGKMVNVSSIGGTVAGIAGMGIGIGILAHTAKNVSKMTDDMYKRPRRRKTQRKGTKLNIPNYWSKY